MPFGTLRRGPLFLLIAVIFTACNTTPKTTLSGQIVDLYTKQPIEGALVTIGKQAGVPTNAEGRYATQSWQPSDTPVVQASG